MAKKTSLREKGKSSMEPPSEALRPSNERRFQARHRPEIVKKGGDGYAQKR